MTDDWAEGELRQTIICNSCGQRDTVTVMVPEDWRDTVAEIIKAHPERYWHIIRDWAFKRGWWAFPGDDGGTLDVCPQCFTLMRHMAMQGGHG